MNNASGLVSNWWVRIDLKLAQPKWENLGSRHTSRLDWKVHYEAPGRSNVTMHFLGLGVFLSAVGLKRLGQAKRKGLTC